MTPDPGSARTLDELIERLRAVKIWAGNPSYQTITNRVNAAWRAAGRPAAELAGKSTVVDCFRPGRRRLNADLVIAVVAALHSDPGYVAQWRQALRVVAAEVQATAQVRVQDTLPADLAEFTGRRAELDRLRRMWRRGAGNGRPVVISAIEGMAGVGKTRLAIHAAHVLAASEPFDRVLFVNLRGFDPDPAQPPADPAAVLDAFLRLLGVPGHRIPYELRARAALYRRRLAALRVLVVLDNAADEEQVAPLLPAGSGSVRCVTLVTSRHRLAGLPGVARLAVDVFTPDEAVRLLTRAAPGIPVGADPAAPARVAHRCGHLPLALSLMAALMRDRPGWTVTDHADRLDERHRTSAIDGGVELALGLSYQHLPAGRRRLFRLLSLHPGADLDAFAAAALADVDLGTATGYLNQLVADHLLQQTGPGRVGFHDLVRTFATRRTVDEDRPGDRRTALTRLFDHYLGTAAAAMDILYPASRHRRPRVPPSITPAPPVAEPDAARAWLDIERVNLNITAAQGSPDHTVQLAATVDDYLHHGGYFHDALTVHTHACRVAHDTGERVAEADALISLGRCHLALGRSAPATDHYVRALAMFRMLDERRGEARALGSISIAHRQQGRYAQAVDVAEQALALFREIGDRLGEARGLSLLGSVYRHWGRYRPAGEEYQRALALFREIGDPQGEAIALNGLGVVFERLGQWHEAVEHHRQALARYRALGQRLGETLILTNLAVVYQRLGWYRLAADHHRQAAIAFREFGDQCCEAEALSRLGETLLADGQPDQARTHHARALTIASRIGDRKGQARAHDGLAHSHHTTGERDLARRHWHDALTIYTELGVPEAAEVRAHLTELDRCESRTRMV